MANTVEYYQQKFRQAETNLNFARSGGNPDEIRVFTARYLAAANDLETAQQAVAGNPPARAVNPAVSPAAEQADATVDEEVGFFGRLFGTSDQDTDISEFAEYGSDLAQAPLPPPATAPVQQNEVDLNLFAEGSDVTDIGETTRVVPQRPPQDAIDRAFGVLAQPDIDETTTIDEFSTIVQDENGQVVGFGGPNDVAGGQVNGPEVIAPRPVDNTQAKEQQLVPDIEIQVPNPEPVEEQQAQINNAALDRLKAQSAIRQNRQPEGKGDWRVKLRLADQAEYFYNIGADEVGILNPLQATDGVVFPYTPEIQILYAADYNTYQPTHSNYQHYFYKGSKVGEIVLTADFTAQDTQEANYLLAVIHFLKSASKMFYGQDADRGSPPPLLFLSGLGDYQFNESPCVISQFNYVLPGDVDYIRANVESINSNTDTLQYNLRQKNAATSPSWAGSTVRKILSNLTAGAEPKQPVLGGNLRTADLSRDGATYVPTSMTMTLTLLPVQSRLQVSQEFSLKDYANGTLITKGFW